MLKEQLFENIIYSQVDFVLQNVYIDILVQNIK